MLSAGVFGPICGDWGSGLLIWLVAIRNARQLEARTSPLSRKYAAFTMHSAQSSPRRGDRRRSRRGKSVELSGEARAGMGTEGKWTANLAGSDKKPLIASPTLIDTLLFPKAGQAASNQQEWASSGQEGYDGQGATGGLLIGRTGVFGTDYALGGSSSPALPVRWGRLEISRIASSSCKPCYLGSTRQASPSDSLAVMVWSV